MAIPLNTGRQGCLHIPIGGCSVSFKPVDMMFWPVRGHRIGSRRILLNQHGRTVRAHTVGVAAGGEANGLGIREAEIERLPHRDDGPTYAQRQHVLEPEVPNLTTASTRASQRPASDTGFRPITAAPDAINSSRQFKWPASERAADTSTAVGVCGGDASSGGPARRKRNWRRHKRRPRVLRDNADGANDFCVSRPSADEQDCPKRRAGEPPLHGTVLQPAERSHGTESETSVRPRPRPRQGKATKGGVQREACESSRTSASNTPIGAAKVSCATIPTITALAGIEGRMLFANDLPQGTSGDPGPQPASGSTLGFTPSDVRLSGGTEEQRPLPSMLFLSMPVAPTVTLPAPVVAAAVAATAAATPAPAAADAGGSRDPSTVRRDSAPGRRHHHQGHRGGRGGTRSWMADPSLPMHPYLLTGILRTASSVPKLQKYVARYGNQFNSFHVCCCLNRLAKAADARAPAQREAVTQLFGELEGMLVQVMADCDARELCNVLWVWGKLGHMPKRETWEAMRVALFGINPEAEETAKAAAASPPPSMPSAISERQPPLMPAAPLLRSPLFSWSPPGSDAEDSLPALAKETEEEAEAGGRVLVRALQKERLVDHPTAVASAATGRDGTYRRVTNECVSPIGSPATGFPPPLTAVQTANEERQGTPSASMAAASASATVAVAVGGKLEQAAPQGLVNAAWALARLDLDDPWAWRRLAECSMAKLHAFIPYDISNLSYAFVVARQHRTHPAHEALMCSLAEAAAPRLTDFCPQDISNMLWAYARAGMAQPALFAAAAPIARLMAEDFGRAGLMQVLWAYATMRVYDAPLLGALARRMLSQLHSLDVGSRVMLCWALARFVSATASAAVGGRGSAAGAITTAAGISLFVAARVRASFVDPLVRLHLTGGQAAVEAAATAARSITAAVAAGKNDGGHTSISAVDIGIGSWETDDGDGLSSRSPTSSISADNLAKAYEEELTTRSPRAGGGSGNGGGGHIGRVSPTAPAATTLSVDWTEGFLEQESSGYGSVAYGGFADAGSLRQRPVAAATPAAVAAASLAQSQVDAYAAAAAAAKAVLSEMPPQLLPALCESLRPQIGSLETGSLAVFVWSLATLGYVDTELFTAAAAELTPRLRRGEVATPFLAHTAWAFTVAGVYDSDLYVALTQAAAELCAAGPSVATSLALSNVIWALGSAGHYNAELYGNVGRAVAAVAAVATAAANVDEVASECTDYRDAVNRLALVMLACAYAGHADPELYGMVSEVLRRAGASALGDNSLANICWALAVVDHADLGLLSVLFEDVARRDTTALGVRGCTQLFQCAIWLQDLVPGSKKVVSLLPPNVLEVGRTNFMELAKDSNVSDFQTCVFNALDSMWLSPSMEIKTSDQLLSLDVAVSLPGAGAGAGAGELRVAVEANGPQHYLRTHPGALEGSTRLRSRLLRARGWVPLHVHWRDWQDLGGDVLRQRRYLRAKLGELIQKEHEQQQQLKEQEQQQQWRTYQAAM